MKWKRPGQSRPPFRLHQTAAAIKKYFEDKIEFRFEFKFESRLKIKQRLQTKNWILIENYTAAASI